jgi:acyl carrier protein
LLAANASGADNQNGGATEQPACAPRTAADVTSTVRRILVEHLGVDESRVTPAATFVGDLGADSLDVVELVMTCEEEFRIEIADDVADKIKTVENLIDVILHSCPLP